MKKQSSLAIMLMLALVAQALGQNPTPQQEPSAEDEEVVRITTNLIQVDATVTDKDGRQVTDLRADEFEILENGQEQTITNFSYVPLAPVAAKPTTPPDKNAPPVPPARLRPEQVQRTIALVIDDLNLSFESINYVRGALKKFVDEQVQPGDLVAIIRTGGSIGTLQQFTSDKRQLYAAIERVRWNRLGRAGLSAVAPLELDGGIGGQTSGDVPDSIEKTDANEELDQLREDIFSTGTLGALNHIVLGLKELPGRKSIMLVSDGLTLFSRHGINQRLLAAMRRLTAVANRASVVVYTMDARGLQGLGLTAVDSVGGAMRSQISDGQVVNPVEQSLLNRRLDFREAQSGLDYLAQETGGLAYRNNNDLSAGLKQILDDQQGYYLIGYRPDEKTFDPKRARFNQLKIKVKRPGLKVRYRSGFFGVTDEQLRPAAPRERAQQLARAIASPFGSGDIGLRLTTLFANDAQNGSFMRSLLHVDSRNLTFKEEADGWHKFTFDVMAVTFGDNGVVVDEVSRTHTVRVRGETHRRIMQNGFDYNLVVPIKKAGAYQLRAALRDSATERVGSASQFVEVPDIGKNRLTLSGIIVNGFDSLTMKNNPGSTAAAQKAEGPNVATDPQAAPAVRIFRRGMVLEFDYVIYNARLDKATRRPQLQTQLRLFRDGQQIYAGNVLPFDAGAQTDLKRLSTGGRLQLGTDMTPGDYVLQLVVTDRLVKGKLGTAAQWIDFQIVDK